MNLGFETDIFEGGDKTDYNSTIMALLHYTKHPCSIIDNKSCIKGKEHSVRFIMCEFESLEEAKRRALLLAFLTYRLTKRTFVPFYTGEMMEQPLILMHLRELWTAYETHNWKVGGDTLEKKVDKDVDPKYNHSGLIISSEDQYLAASHPYIKIRVKTQKGSYGEPDEIIEVEKDIIITSTKQEVNFLKQEAIEKEKELEGARLLKAREAKDKIKQIGRKEPANIHIVKSNNFGIDKADLSQLTTRLNSGRDTGNLLSPLRAESGQAESSTGRTRITHKRNSSIFPNTYNEDYFKYTTAKERARDMHKIRAEMEEKKKAEITKVREINKLMKTMGKEEHQNNIKLFQKYNEDEKQIIGSLIKKAKEKDINDKLTRRLQVIKASRRKELAQSDTNFALNFTRQKNLIEKYEQAGEKSKRIRNERLEKLGKVKTLKAYKSNKPKFQLSTQVFDTSFVDEKYNKECK